MSPHLPAEEAPPKPESRDAAAAAQPGHSMHGEAFNEGPRQKAYLLGTTSNVHMTVTTKNPEAQAFFDQGLGQLHGFWYFEAERSFRQAATLDPDCAMAYWGMAMANTNNAKRAKAFIAEAVKRKDKVTERERLFIEARDGYLKAETGKNKERNEAYAAALEKLLLKYPDDIEAKAFLIVHLWESRAANPITSYLAIDALLDQVFAVNPMHPAHHYRIHLWDGENAQKAVASAAVGGATGPGIAHLWHMPGHTYSKLKRYDDAVWQQEASARVDHAHMMRDRILPDQIHNFAHNNEWLIRNFNFIGRVRDAVSLAKNMSELPRHPKYNTLKSGSARFGRMRLIETLARYELWEEAVALCQSGFIEPTDDDAEQIKRTRLLGMALIRRGDPEAGRALIPELQKQIEEQSAARDKAGTEAANKARDSAVDRKKLDDALAAAEKKAHADGQDEAGIQQARTEAEQASRAEQIKAKEKDITKAEEDAKRPITARINRLEKAIQELEGHLAVAAGDFKQGYEKLKAAGDADAGYLALIQYQAGETEAALKAVQNHINGRQNEVQPLALQIDLLWMAGKKDDARKAFEKLRDASGSIDDLAYGPFARLKPIAQELGLPEDWRVTKPRAADFGTRPELDSLGPFRWQPSPAIDWTLKDATGRDHTLAQYRDRPLIVIFYLGYGCLHCAEQLQKFAPMKDEFTQAGFSVVAISTDSIDNLKQAIGSYDGATFPITLLSNHELDVFKSWRCFDDFEQKPLHGTFVLDTQGRIRWQDISYEPFMDPKFVLTEAKRLLNTDAAPAATTIASRQAQAGSPDGASGR